jgi:hypothetical protein
MLKKMTFRGGDTVRFGFYWNRREWEARIVPKEGGTLPGAPEVTYLRLPLVAVLVLAPLMGAAYAMFLPFIGFAMVAMYLAGLLKRTFTRTPPAAEATVPERAAGIVDKKAA